MLPYPIPIPYSQLQAWQTIEFMIFFIRFFLGESMTEISVLQVVLALDKLVSSVEDLSKIKELMMPDLRHRIRVIATAKVKRVLRD